METENFIPNPEFLIKSIAEQGYTLETSIADLIDNSLTANANKVEVLIDTNTLPFCLYISDDGIGMTKDELRANMKFPSSSMEAERKLDDLGRFGLGLKTASFSQTRRFTVLSKKSNEIEYSALTWDVNHLKETGKWEIIVNLKEDIETYLLSYRSLSNSFLNRFVEYRPNTIIVWQGLYKFENDLSLTDKSQALRRELNGTIKEYLQLIFHRFMEKPDPFSVRINNDILKPFNPFPSTCRNVSIKEKLLIGNKLKLEGFILPNKSIEQSKEKSEWTLTNKSLMDMEGIYVYRSNRLIVFGGWNGVVKKSPRLQLARLKVEISNGIDHLFQLNVAKSSIVIPLGERFAFARYVNELKKEAEKEFFNYEIKAASSKRTSKSIFKKIPTNNGMTLEIDKDFPLVKLLSETLNETQNKQLTILFRMIATTINKIKKVHNEESYISILEKDELKEADWLSAIAKLLECGYSKTSILDDFIPMLGIDKNNLPVSISNLLK